MSGDHIVSEELTLTVDSDTAIPCLTASLLARDKAVAVEIEFDVELYVNGKRWI